MAGQHEEFDPIVRGASLILAFQLKGKRVVIVGGGQVAAGRLSAVLAADAIVTLISPSSGLSPEVRHRIFVEKVVDRYEDRVFGGEEDLEGADMCLTAIDEVGLSSKIYEMCKRRRIIVNVADVPPECDIYFGSVIRRGPLQVMVSTGGKGPRIANRIRRLIEESIPLNAGEAIENVGKLRMGLRKKAPERDPVIGKRRMDWMIKVCDKWSLDELAIMDDEMREKVLLGWEEEKAPGYNDVRPGSSSFSGAISSSLRSVAGCLTSPVLLSGISGIAVGAALTAAIAHRTLQK